MQNGAPSYMNSTQFITHPSAFSVSDSAGHRVFIIYNLPPSTGSRRQLLRMHYAGGQSYRRENKIRHTFKSPFI